ncbi:hypothetical protein O3P69_018916 [Scylla paramamosain]|uniref:Bromo domain-containing protein n=1 Tax=Scylla paramamosain TaxID=85552 RepID=A0AAW0SHC5_SCYPA
MLNEMREMSDAQPFLFPVNVKQVPDYYNIVNHPMDLSTIRDNLRQKKYQSREEFLSDISQIVENSKLYNGVKSTLTVTAQKMLELCIDRFAEKEERLMRLEKAINPLLDDDDQVAFDYILDNIVNQKLFSMQESWPFMKPVNKKNVKDYYEIIQSPMDLSTIAKKVKNHKYHSRAEFMQDMELILTNSIRYNGQDSAFTQKAETLLQVCKDSLAEYEAHLDGLEKKIALAQERALEQAETDSLCTSLGPDDDTNYTFAEPEQDPPDHQMGSPSDHLINYSGDEDEEHVNVVDGEEEEMMQTPKRRRLQQEKRNVLEEDLEFSDDEEDYGMQQQDHHQQDQQQQQQQHMEEMSGADMVEAGMVLEGQYGSHQQGPDETQGAAEAMVQLSAQYSYYQGETGEYNPEGLGTEGNMEVDASYDPSVEFLGGMMPSQPHDDATINNDLAVSDSDDEAARQVDHHQQMENPPQEEEDDKDALWF